MWPWSTIRQLKADAAMWERQYHKAHDLWEGAHTRQVELLRELSELRSRIVDQGVLRGENEQLRAKLEKLTTRGPGGRFVKVDTVVGKSSGEIGH